MTEPGVLPPAAERRASLEARFSPWRPMTISQTLDRAAAEFPDRPLVIDDDQTLT